MAESKGGPQPTNSVPDGPHITQKDGVWVAEDAQGKEIGRSGDLGTLQRFLNLGS